MKNKSLIILTLISVFFFCVISCTQNDSPTPDPSFSPATRELQQLVEDNIQLKSLLNSAIMKGAQINPDKTTNPAQSLKEYYEFVNWASKSMPWTVLSQPEGTDIFTRIDQSLNYLFFINDIPLEELEGKSLYNNSLQYAEPYRSWLKTFAKEWGAYLDTEASWGKEYYDIVRKEEIFGISKGWYENSSKWKTFNDFFARHLSSPSVRPIASYTIDAIVTSPADAVPQGVWKIDKESYIQQKEGVQIKSKKFSSVAQLLGENSPYKDYFAGGTLTHSFLNVYDYHRYHFPMSGTIKDVKLIKGDYAVGGTITYNPTTKKYDIFCDTPGWQSIETRGCVILETEQYGYVALLPIGMMPVTSINWENNIKVGTKVKKGDMLGYFLFGGSDFVIIFKNGVNFELTVSPEGNGYKHLLMGEELGKLTLKE